MEKSKLYTGTGDNGTTSLVGGQRVKKNSLRLEAYGTVDEFSAHLSLLSAHPDTPADIKKNIDEVQNKMFNIGADLATLPTTPLPDHPYGLTEEDCAAVEHWTDVLDAAVPAMNSFILPGGTMAAAMAHVARTVCRRTERRILSLAEVEPVHPLILKYFNRLSDWLFILARYYKHIAGTPDQKWEKP